VYRVYLVGVDLECRWKAWAENLDASKGYILDEYIRRLSDLAEKKGHGELSFAFDGCPAFSRFRLLLVPRRMVDESRCERAAV
jgi:hypothetical protein